MREKAKELQRQRMESVKRGMGSMGGRSYGGGISEGFGNSGGISNTSSAPSIDVRVSEIKTIAVP